MHAISRTELDKMQCDNPDCTEEHDPEVYFHSRCHPSSAMTAMYNKKTGRLHLFCHECNKPVCEIEVGHADNNRLRIALEKIASDEWPVDPRAIRIAKEALSH